MRPDRDRLRSAWLGRVSGCQLGKAVEMLSMRDGFDALTAHLEAADALPIRDYIPYREGARLYEASCRGRLTRSEPDDDVMYSVLALTMLEKHGEQLSTEDVARSWLNLVPAGGTWTAERAAYRILMERAPDWFVTGVAPGFDVTECADNEFNDWIGAQIRADVYGWVLPGEPSRAAELARRDAALSHRDDGIWGAVFVAACGAAIPATDSFEDAVARAEQEVPGDSLSAEAIGLGRSLVGDPDAIAQLRAHYGDMSPVHVLNNLALVVWGLLSHPDDFSAAIGDTVAAGWDTDCTAATVGGLWGLSGRPIPDHWTAPWSPRVAVPLAGVGELDIEDLVDRTFAVAQTLSTPD